MNTFKEILIEHGACKEAVDWAEGKTYEEAYSTCERADWMIWLFARNWGKPGFPTKRQVLLAACDCAETSLAFAPEGELRPAQAIASARLAIEDPSEENLEAAYAASSAAYAAAHADGTFSRAAESASSAAYAASSAAYAAWHSAKVIYYVAAAGASSIDMCNLIRARIEVKP